MSSDFNILNTLEANFNSKPISIVEFAESKKFCNRILYPRQRLLLKLIFLEDLTDAEEAILDTWLEGGRGGTEVEICPDIREKRQWLKANGYKHFREVCLVGGRRCSKGFITGLSLAKKMYDTLQLQDPGKHYGIDADKEIFYSCVAASQDQAKEMQYADFSAMVNSCNAMNRYVGKLQETEFSVMTETDIRKLAEWKRMGRKVQRDISTLRGKALPANSRTIRGSATMAIVFDEFAHFMQGESDQSDNEVYAAAIPALAQFGRDALIFCNSSPYSKTGKFYQRYEVGMGTGEEDEDEETNPGGANAILSMRFPSWALYDGWWEDPTYVGPKKCITVSPDWDWDKRNEDGSYYYTEQDRHAIISMIQEEKDDPQKFKVERRGHFAEVVDAYLIPEMVDRMFEGRPEWNEEEKHILRSPLKTNWDSPVWPHVYYAHLDPSSTTAGFGFAMGHTEELMIRGKSETHVIFDVIKRWNPKEFVDGVIDWEPILEEVIFYCNVFRPRSLTLDQHQSAMPIQYLKREFRKRSIETRVWEKVPNIRTNWFRAETFRTALYRDLVHAPDDTADTAYCGLELKFLQEIKTSQTPRVEKQDEGPVQTKDMADCVMEVVEVSIGNIIAGEEREDLAVTPSYGAPGGYRIGADRSERAKAFSAHYASRHGEQSFRGGSRNPISPAPNRRPFGGRPLPRRLPGA